MIALNDVFKKPADDGFRPKPEVKIPQFKGTDQYPQGLMIGLDVGSTTVKAVVVNPVNDEVLWKDYQRHDTKQPEKCLEFFKRIREALPDVPNHAIRVFMTGSGGTGIGRHINAKFVQEVNAVSLAVEKSYPDVNSVIELGGQDAKIIVFRTIEETGRKKKIPSMNDKCAGGTGAVIDKINAKLRIPSSELCNMGYFDLKLHPVAGKCGVFAETDINGLQKQGVPPSELMASLFESIIMQNMSVLTRGYTLKPVVMLLGGPNCYIKGMRDCWRHNLPLMWKERNVEIPEGKSIEELIIVPDNAQYFAALGAVEFAKIEVVREPEYGVFAGTEMLEWYLEVGRVQEKQARGSAGLAKNAAELDAFKEKYKKEKWVAPKLTPGTVVEAFVGLDGGSTSTKAVLVDHDRNLIAKAYQLSKGNPIEDTMEMFAALQQQIADQGCTLKVLGVGTTGYAKDILKDVLKADVALVETVAHTEAGLFFYPGTDVIVDVGGQDIKLIVLKNGAVKDFKLNTQCSAGNGYFLQSTASGFGFDVTQFADIAFSAKAMPEFGYGCAVFMQSDIVDFQRQGWEPKEIMAGLANVLPKNIWLYVSQIPNLAKLGTKFLLQGGTQHNLAAVKSQVDFIQSRFVGSGTQAEVIVHKHCGESGAIGCGLEAHRLYHEMGHRTSFIGLERVSQIKYRTTRNEATRCYFCKNKCLRTFIDAKTVKEEEWTPPTFESKVPLMPGEQRLIIATCEKGTVEDINAMRGIKAGLDEMKKKNPNLVTVSSKQVFYPKKDIEITADAPPSVSKWQALVPGARKKAEDRAALIARRAKVKIGMPRVLNAYAHTPFMMGWFQSIGVDPKNIIFSDYTSEELYKEGAKRGAIDPCFPSKIAIPHIHNLLFHKHKKTPLDYIVFPMIDSLPTWLENVQAKRACPTVVHTIEAAHGAFIKEGNMFEQNGIKFFRTFMNLDEPLLCARQLAQEWGPELGVTEEESRRAVKVGLEYYEEYHDDMRKQARVIIDDLVREKRLGIVLLARPYHNDPGLNHEILEEFQKLGYPVLTQDSLPLDKDILEQLFGEEVRAGAFKSPVSIEDAWKNSYSENTSRKVWAAKYTARHPNLVALELSSFKCGHDAPIYSVIEEIIENSGTPYFSFKDIDENKPTGSIRIRVETIDYFLRRYRQKRLVESQKRDDIETRLREMEARLRSRGAAAPTPGGVRTTPVVNV